MPSLFSIPGTRRVSMTVSVVILCAGLTGCLSLKKKEEAPAAAAIEKPAAPDAATQPAGPGKPVKTAGYVDPFVSKNNSPHPTKIAAAPKTTGLQVAQADTPQPVPPAANQLGQVVNQSTGINAGSNSIFALAQPPAPTSTSPSGSNTGAAYAPTRNINAMAGSVFSLRPPSAPTAITSPPPGNSGGLW